jgi:protocatechuate 3,4-dioxygenase beta subunit
MDEQLELTRRRLLELGLALPVPFVLAACGGGGSDEAARTTTQATTTGEGTTTLAPTPACDDGDDATPEQTEGPFFTPDSPERTSFLESGIEGTRLVLAGSVLATDCTPVAGALLDFWHADAQGEYDNEGYRLRGHQFADRRGRYRLETIVPGVYTGRTRHIHVKVQAPDRPVLTTQLYFPGEPGNDSDSIFDPSLLVELRRSDTGAARFDFVLGVV